MPYCSTIFLIAHYRHPSMWKLPLFIGLLCSICLSTQATPSDCSDNCLLRFRCNPYYKDYVWSIVDEKCRVFQNGCIFASENCTRVNRCLPEMVATTQEQCQERCSDICTFIYQPVCAAFPYTNDTEGSSDIRYRTFSNRCVLDSYACKRGHAYVGEPQAGACNATTV
ncbi:uncharacterized protein LOC115621476 [Scaptodrosophila lebanonensis]|uniref:Uncharacterized protein LOC115621476 n=1 Tax=Drosophila lebanonensis TaxID=7225 RepID=A0A6J2T268_DROLE|nr:uncharacterized protein LOC115621476 [Scaptodrosophila lebanonensis]